MSPVVLLGAGASFGSGAVAPHVPPLGPQLFAELAREFPDLWGALGPRYANVLKHDFELGMQRLMDETDALGPLQRSMAAYFFKLSPKQNNLYRSFARARGRHSP